MVNQEKSITALLAEVQGQDERAFDFLFPRLYDELHAMAKNQLKSHRSNHTFTPTALVNELYIKFTSQWKNDWTNRAHFLGVSSLIMRRILLTYARKRNAAKRGGGINKVTLKSDQASFEVPLIDILSLDNALNRLEKVSERACNVVVMRFYGGLTLEEIAEALSISVPTVKRDWKTAKAWLSHELSYTLP